MLQSQCPLSPGLTADCSRFLLISDVSQLLQFRLTITRIAILFPIYLFPFRYWLFVIVFWSSWGIQRPLDTHTQKEKPKKASITASVRHCRDQYLVLVVEYPEAHFDDHLLTSFSPQLALFLLCSGCCYVDILVIIPFFSFCFHCDCCSRFYSLLFGYTMYIQLARC